MNHGRKIIVLILLMGLIAAPVSSVSVAQDDTQSCPEITRQALEMTKAMCEGTERNEICYGHILLEASAQPNVATFKFDAEGDIESVTDMASLRLSAMDTVSSTWGVALMRIEVNLLNELKRNTVMLLLFGDVEISNRVNAVPSVTFPVTVSTDGSHARVRGTPNGPLLTTLSDGDEVTATGRTKDTEWIRVTLENGRSAWVASFLLDSAEALDTLDVVDSFSAIYAPMQVFYVESEANDAPCQEAPNSGLMIQTPEGVAEVSFLVNEVNIQLDATAFFEANPGDDLTVSVLEGSVSVTSDGVTRRATAGSQISVPLGEDGSASGIPSLPRPYDMSSMAALPTAYMDTPVEVPQPISQDDLARLILSQTTTTQDPTAEPVTVDEQTGQPVVDQPGVPSTGGQPGVQPTAVVPPPPPPTSAPTTMTICHNAGNNRFTTMEVDPATWPGHQKHGDTPGACP